MTEKIVLAVSGSIAAYKAVELARLLKKEGCSVRTVMTEHARQFIHPNVFAAVTGERVYTDLFDAVEPMAHIDLAKWADKIVIAPASASLMGRLANGLCTDLLTSVCLATRAKIFIAPAMNQFMWEHPLLQKNVQTLKQLSYQFVGPVEGMQACGDTGFGRLMEVEAIAAAALSQPTLTGETVLITAGPTREAIDPVRFLSNHSSGKMGYALAQAFRNRGAHVILISGPTALKAPERVEFVTVTTADEMCQAVLANIDRSHVFVSCAAVADYKVKTVSDKKLKKSSETLTLTLTKTPDILQLVSERNPRPFLVGFAVETDNLSLHARTKLQEKNLDLIVANQMSPDFSPFDSDFNKALIIDRNMTTLELPKLRKVELAEKIADMTSTSLRTW